VRRKTPDWTHGQERVSIRVERRADLGFRPYTAVDDYAKEKRDSAGMNEQETHLKRPSHGPL
jgi:hypothetical protein